jgi:hypothetical protein
MTIPLFVQLPHLQKLFDQGDQRNESQVVAAFKAQLAELPRQVQEQNDDIEAHVGGMSWPFSHKSRVQGSRKPMITL